MPRIHHRKNDGQRQKIDSLPEPPNERTHHDGFIEHHEWDAPHKGVQLHTTVAYGMDREE